MVLKLETAVSLGSAKQFQGDGKEVADLNHPIELYLINDWTSAYVMTFFFALHLILRRNLYG